jgi:CheY-like chemotaxis protein
MSSEWTVLIIDDEPHNIGVAQYVLNFNDAKVVTASTGAEGLEHLKQVTPTFVLLDLAMPRMTGWDILKEIRGNPATKDVVVIAFTAHAMIGDKDRALQEGFDGFIPKPIRPMTFIAELTEILKNVQRIPRSS